MFPLWLVQFPLTILTIFFVVLFSTSLWANYDNFYNNEVHEAIDSNEIILICYIANLEIRSFESELLYVSNCEYEETIENGKIYINKLISQINGNLSQSCKMENDIMARQTLITKDINSISDAIDLAEHLLKQIDELKTYGFITSDDDLREMKFSKKIIEKTLEELKELKEVCNYYNAIVYN